MTQKRRLQVYQDEVHRLMNAAYDGEISQNEMSDEIDDLVHPLVGKRLHECSDDERLIVSAWFKHWGDEHMRRADDMLPGISANPGIGSIQ